MGKQIKVLVAEDSLVSQNFFRRLITSDSHFELAGIASNGQQVVEMAKRLKPDVISMDIHMPLMDGIEATRIIMQDCPVPILIVSSLYTPESFEMAMEVLKAGAVGILSKPNGPGHPQFESDARSYLRMLRTYSEVKVVTRKNANPRPEMIPEQGTTQPGAEAGHYRVLVIGASAGGPEAVRTILHGLKPGLTVPVLVVQHIDPHFIEGYCQWLGSHTHLPVKIATDDETPVAGQIYLPSQNKHLIIKPSGKIGLSDEPPAGGHRPAVARLFQSAADVHRHCVVAVLLSGMGKDGAAELKVLRDRGAYTIAQSEQSCLVYGMPGEAVKLGAAFKVLSPVEIISELNQLL